MKTRCTPGCRAKIIKAENTQNIGLIVIVLRKYIEGEEVSGSAWSHDGNAWVVTAIGAPVISWNDKEGFGANQTAVMNDLNLVPLTDDEDGLTSTTSKRPRTKRKETA